MYILSLTEFTTDLVESSNRISVEDVVAAIIKRITINAILATATAKRTVISKAKDLTLPRDSLALTKPDGLRLHNKRKDTADTVLRKSHKSRIFRASRHSYRRRGYSIVEVAVALAVFTLIAGVVTVAIARAQFTSASLKFEREVREVVASLVTQASTNNYRDIVEGSFVRPSPCFDSFTTSCVDVQGRVVTVEWFVEELVNEAEGDLPSKVTLRAMASMPQGNFVNSSRVILLPKGLDQRESILNVTLTGEPYTGSVYLISQSGKQLDSAEPASGTLTFRTTADSCTLSRPCYLALTGSGDSYTGDPSDPSTLTLSSENSQRIVLRGGVESSITVSVTRTASLELDLVALNPEGYTGSPGVLGSVCLWVSFNEGSDTKEQGYCNDLIPSKIIIKNFSGPKNEYRSFTEGQSVTLRVDNSLGSCPKIKGGKAYTAKGWLEGSVCTSYTWGVPSQLIGNSGTTTFNGANVTLTSGTNLYTVQWEGAATRPASGYTGENTWSWPRVAGDCYETGSCSPLADVPELSQCPNKHCYFIGKNPPVVTSPNQGQGIYATPVSSNSTSTINIDWIDTDNKPHQVVQGSLVESPSGGSLQLGGEEVAEGGVLFSQYGNNGNLALSYTPNSFTGLDSFTVRLEDESGSFADYKIGLYSGNKPWLVKYNPSLIKQATNAELKLQVIGTEGTPVQGAAVAVTKKPKRSDVLTATTNSSGQAVLNFYPNNARSGKHTITVTATKNDTSITQDIDIYIQESVSKVTISSASIAQGTSSGLVAQALGSNSEPVANALVSISVTSGPGGDGITIRPSACLTNTEGVCLINAYASSSTTNGTYAVQAESEGKVGSGNILVSDDGVTITGDLTTVSAGGTAKVLIKVLTAGGSPVSGANLVVSGSSGLGVTSNPPTNALGQTTLTITASAEAAGEGSLTISYDGSSSVVPVSVVSQASYVALDPDEFYLWQDQQKLVVIKAYDATGRPVSGLDLVVQPGDLEVTENGPTDSTGETTVVIKAPKGAAVGDRFVSVFSNDKLLDSIVVKVVKGISRVEILDKLTKGSTQEVRVRFWDTNNKPLADSKVGLESLSSSVAVNSNALTDDEGVASFEVYVKQNSPSGAIDLKASYSGGSKEIQGFVQ